MSSHTLAEWKEHEVTLMYCISHVDSFESPHITRQEYQKILADALKHARTRIAEIESEVLAPKTED